MQVTLKNMTFGRHQTFPLRFGWLTKGFRAVVKDSKVFDREDNTVVLGVGNNMVDAVRYWLRAAKIINVDSVTITAIGKAIFAEQSGYDPYLEDEATLWLIHWLLATHATMATAIFWFFNYFHKGEFTYAEVTQVFTEFVKNANVTVSQNTLEKDITLILRMYTPSHDNKSLEESLDSPLATLGLINYSSDTRKYYTGQSERLGLPCEIIGFAITELLELYQQTTLPVENLMYSKNTMPALGAIFRLSESALLARIEQLIKDFPQHYALRETAGIHQLYQLQKVNALMFLESYYKQRITA